MIRQLLALLAVVTLSISSGALAETVGSEGGAAACSVMQIPDNNHSLTLTTFIPDAGCWYESTITLMADAGAFEMTASFAKYLLVILYGIYGVTALLDKKSRAQWVRMTIATIAVGSLLMTPNNRQDLTSYIRVTMLNSWAELYEVSAGYAQGLLSSDRNEEGSLGNYVRSLMEQMATMEYNSAVFERVRGDINSKLESRDLGGNADEIKSNVLAILNEDQARSRPQFDTMSLWTTIGSFMVMGLFTVFAALIYSTAINLIITALMLPIQLAFVGVLQWGYFTKGLIGFAASLITTVMVSVFAVAVMQIAIGAPASAMTQHISDTNRVMEQSIVRYAQQWENCNLNVGCQVQNFALDLGVQAQSVRGMVVTLGLTLLMVIVSSGIAMNQLRRIPAAISGAIGISGGGESSGTGSNPLGTLATAAGVTALSNKLKSNMANRMAGGASGKPAAKAAGSDGASSGAGGSTGGGKTAGGAGEQRGTSGGSQGADSPTPPVRPPEAEGAAEGKAVSPPSLGERAANYISNLPADRVAASRQLLASTGRGVQAIADRTGDRQLVDRIGAMASPVARGIGNTADRIEQTREALQNGGLKGMVQRGEDRLEMARAQAGAVQMAFADRAFKDGAPNANVRPSQRPAPTPSEAGQRFQQDAQTAYGNANVRTLDTETSSSAETSHAPAPTAGLPQSGPTPIAQAEPRRDEAGVPNLSTAAASSAGAPQAANTTAGPGTPAPTSAGPAGEPQALASANAANPPPPPASPVPGHAADGARPAPGASGGFGTGGTSSPSGNGLRARADRVNASRTPAQRGQLSARSGQTRVDPNATAPYRPPSTSSSASPTDKGSTPPVKTSPGTQHARPEETASAPPTKTLNMPQSTVATTRQPAATVTRPGEKPLPTAVNGGRLQATPARGEASYSSTDEMVRDYKGALPKDSPASAGGLTQQGSHSGTTMTIDEAREAPVTQGDLPTSDSVGERPTT